MSEQPDLFPKGAEKAEELKKKDILHRRKTSHKSTQAIRDMRRLVRAIKDKSNKEPLDPDSIIVKPK